MNKEALRYLENAKKILSKALREDSTYSDIKHVQEGCGTAYLAILKAIDASLVNKGVNPKDLPQSVEGYRRMMKKYLSAHNGKLQHNFEALYQELHIAGYYRGLLRNVAVVKEVFKAAERFIGKLSSLSSR